MLLSHDDGLVPGVGFINPSSSSLLLPEAHPVSINRPPGTSPLGISASKALPVSSNRQLIRQQYQEHQQSPSGWNLLDETNLDNLDEYDPSGEPLVMILGAVIL